MQNLTDFYFQSAYFVILAAAFAFGAVKLFKSRTPLYFQLYVIACGCMMMEHLISVVLLLCDKWTDGFTAARFFGTFSFSLFILSANRGTLDGIVDDRAEKQNSKARILAFAAPIIFAVLIIVTVFLNIKSFSVISGILMLITLSPVIPASYYNFKHLILPTDEMELLKATYGCNIFALAFQLSNVLYNLLLSTISKSLAVMLAGIFVYLMAGLLVVAAVRGREKWKI